MLSERIDKHVYTKNIDGTTDRWYLEQLFEKDGICLVRKLPRCKWIDTRLVFPISDVYETKREATKAVEPSRRIY